MRKLLCGLMILILALNLCGAIAESTLLLKKGNTGDVVKVLQKDLTALGYFSGKADGHYGEDTAKAVQSYRVAKQLSKEGGVDADMVLAIYEDQGNPTLSTGSAGICVYAVQRALVIAGFLNDTPDGKFGKSTKEAFKSYMKFAANEMVSFAQDKEDARVSGLEALNAAEMPVPVDEAIINAETVITDGSINDVWFEFIISGQVSYGPTLKKGNKSTAVKRMQLRLQALKYLAAGTDGSFGTNTQRALKYFQYKNKLPQTGEFCHVVLSLPRFKTESTLEMRDLLVEMGLPVSPYSELVENSEGMEAISKVIHKANITVDETGTEAAAVTVIEMKFTEAGPNPNTRTVTFTADHPFLYTISETTSGVILFTGLFNGE